MSRFDKINNQKGDEGGPAVPAPPTTNGTTPYHPAPKPPASPSKRKADADTDRDLTPPPKKAKKAPPIETDEQLAKRMQAELNAPSARSTRGGGTTAAKKKGQTIKGRKDVTPSKSRKKKSKAKIRSEDDSEVNSSGSDGEDNKPVRARTGGFHVSLPFPPPPHLSISNDFPHPLQRSPHKRVPRPLTPPKTETLHSL